MKPSRKQNILVAGHPLVVDANRSVWNELGALEDFTVDLIVPNKWKSNLIKNLNYSKNPDTDGQVNRVFALTAFFKGNGSLTFFNPFSLWSTLSNSKYDRIIITQETWSLSLFVITLVSFFTRNSSTPIDLWVCQNIKKEQLKWLIPFERLNCIKVENILCCCAEIEEVIRWKKLNKRCRYFPFSFSASQYQSLQEVGQFNQPFKMGYIGRLSEEKGMDLLEGLIKNFENENLSVELHIAGSGPWEEKWAELAQQTKNRSQKIIYYGVLKHQEAFKFYENVHAILLPSITKPFWKEQFGRVIIEAAASGRAVIGSSSGAIPEVMAQVQMPFNFIENNLSDFTKKAMDCRSLFLNGEINDLLDQSKKLAFEKFDHASVGKRASEYILSPLSNLGVITDSKLSE